MKTTSLLSSSDGQQISTSCSSAGRKRTTMKNHHQRRRKSSGMLVPLCHTMLILLILSSSPGSSSNNNSGCFLFVSSFTATSTSSSRTAKFSLRKMNTSNKGSRFLGQSVSSISSGTTGFRVGGSTRSISGLSMHMGHSHSHHHHHDHSHNEAPKLSRSQRQKKRRRRAAMFVFAALAILGPPFIRNKFTGVGRTDVAVFVLTSVVLSTSDSIRRELVYMINKMKNLRQGLIKHAPQPSEYAETNSKRKSKIRQLLAYIDIPFFNKKNNSDGMAVSGGSAGAVALSPSYEASMSVTDEREEADNVTILGVIVNLLLSLGKFVVGVTCNSSALIADAGHSLSDLFSDFVTLYTVQIARLPPDDDHPYGHGKFEAIGSLFLSLTLLGTGISIGAMANKELIQVLTTQHKNNAAAVAALKIPKPPALLMAGISILSKEWLFQITNKVGQKLNSQIVIANAWHHRSDAYSSVLALVSIGLAMYIPGLLALDAAAGLLVAGMIGMTGGEILVDSINQLSDSTNTYIQQQVDDIIQNYTANNGDIINVDKIRARSVGGASAVVDVSITISSDILSTSATRVVEENIKRRILDELGNSVVDVIVRAVGVAPTPTVQQQKVDSLSLRNAAASSLSQQEQTQSSSTQLGRSEDVVDVVNGGESSSNSNIATNEAGAAPTLDDSHHNHDHGHDHHEHSHDHDHHESHDHGSHNHDHDHSLGGAYQDCGEELPCVSQIETNLRQTLLEHPDIDSVKSMTVNYIDMNNNDNDNESDALLSSSSSSVAVDVVISLSDDQDNMSIQHAKQVVKEARESIINTEDNVIEDANIYLDFNDDQNVQIESISIGKDDVESKDKELLTTATAASTVSTINGDMGGAATTNTTTLTATHTYKP